MLNIKYLLEICLGATDLKSNEYLSVSVVVPFYNRSGFLKRLLDSVAVQTLPADKVYIIDNGSSLEETLKAWEIITDHIIYDKCVFTSSIGKGNANYARNLGYELADTKHVAFLDSDDWWEPEHLKDSIDCLVKSDKDAVYSGARIHTEYGCHINKSRDVNVYENPFKLILSSLGYIAQTSSYVIDKKKINENVLWDEDLKRHQDFDYFASIFYNSNGWCYCSKINTNIDWDKGGTGINIDFNSLVIFYEKWKFKIPKEIKKSYLRDKYIIAYKYKADKTYKNYYREEIKVTYNIVKFKSIRYRYHVYLNIHGHMLIVDILDSLKLKKTIKNILRIS